MTPTERGIIHARISIYKSSPPRRGAGVAEQGCLLSSYPGKTGIGGSNPPLSAISRHNPCNKPLVLNPLFFSVRRFFHGREFPANIRLGLVDSAGIVSAQFFRAA